MKRVPTTLSRLDAVQRREQLRHVQTLSDIASNRRIKHQAHFEQLQAALQAEEADGGENMTSKVSRKKTKLNSHDADNSSMNAPPISDRDAQTITPS